jgi:hypothetical protein
MTSIVAMGPRSKEGDYSNEYAQLVACGCNFVKVASSAEGDMML